MNMKVKEIKDTKELKWLLGCEESYRYKMLDRMRSDCEFYLYLLGTGEDRLWAKDKKLHIECMKAVWKSFPNEGKPKWLTWEQILEYEDYIVKNKVYTLEWVLKRGDVDRHAILGRLVDDCNNYIRTGSNNVDWLWRKDTKEQIKYIKAIWKSFKKYIKPSWLTWEQILAYENEMCK